jgi:hypothetical protein
VLLHELGHVVGLGHARGHALMAESLPAGVRRPAPGHDDEGRDVPPASLALALPSSGRPRHASHEGGGNAARPPASGPGPGRKPTEEKQVRHDDDRLRDGVLPDAAAGGAAEALGGPGVRGLGGGSLR